MSLGSPAAVSLVLVSKSSLFKSYGANPNPIPSPTIQAIHGHPRLVN